MKLLIATVLLIFASTGSFAQDKKGDAPDKKPTAQQQRMKDCNAQASDKDMKGDERKKFMGSCLKGEAQASSKRTAQQERMASCNKDAGAKKLKGEERKAFMSGCLKG